MRFGIYARVSTNKKDDGKGKSQDPELQLNPLREYAKARGWETKEYVDIGESGAKDSRPQLNALLEDARKRRIDGILVWKLDRFGRSLKSLLNMLEELRSLGVQFVSYTENLDFSTPTGRAMANLIGVFAEFERDLIKERVRAGIQNAKAKGIHIGRRSLIDEELLNAIDNLRHEGTSIRGIAKQLSVSVGLVHKVCQICRPETVENRESESMQSLFT
jgi:DNA invertase Pin-like site-specific DNA recombinase